MCALDTVVRLSISDLSLFCICMRGGLTFFLGSALASASVTYSVGYATLAVLRAKVTLCIWNSCSGQDHAKEHRGMDAR